MRWALCCRLGAGMLIRRERWWIWVDMAALVGYIVLFNAIVMVFLTYFERVPLPLLRMANLWGLSNPQFLDSCFPHLGVMRTTYRHLPHAAAKCNSSDVNSSTL